MYISVDFVSEIYVFVISILAEQRGQIQVKWPHFEVFEKGKADELMKYNFKKNYLIL